MTDHISTPDPIPPSPLVREMIDPHMLRPAHKRWNDPRFAGGKFYYAVLIGAQVYRARRTFHRAFGAELYAKRLLARWIRLYDAAIGMAPNVQLPELV